MPLISAFQNLFDQLSPQTLLAGIASIGLHALIGLSLPSVSAYSKTDELRRDINVLELSPEEQSRIPQLSAPPVQLPSVYNQFPAYNQTPSFPSLPSLPPPPPSSLPTIPSYPPLPSYPSTLPPSSKNSSIAAVPKQFNLKQLPVPNSPSIQRQPQIKTTPPNYPLSPEQVFPQRQFINPQIQIPTRVSRRRRQTTVPTFKPINPEELISKLPSQPPPPPPLDPLTPQSPVESSPSKLPFPPATSEFPPRSQASNLLPVTPRSPEVPVNVEPPASQLPIQSNPNSQQTQQQQREEQLFADTRRLRENLSRNENGTTNEEARKKYVDWLADVRQGKADQANITSENYPEDACLKKLEGSANVGVLVDTNGNVIGEPVIIKSSGYPILNQQAKRDAKSRTFSNNTQEPKPYLVKVDFEYKQQSCPSPSLNLSEPPPEG